MIYFAQKLDFILLV